MIVSFPVVENKSCDNIPVIDKLDGIRNGAYAAWLSPKGIKLQSAEEIRGKRPWND